MIRGEDGFWIDTDVFREDALRFKSDGYYCSHMKGSGDYNEFWDERLRRCIEGYKVYGEKITGNHYFYLNFCNINMIDVIDDDGDGDVKRSDFPSFWDWDYEYFWWLDIARFGVLGRYSQAKEMLSDSERKRLESGGYSKDELLELKKDIIYNRLKLKLRTDDEWLDGGHHIIVAKSRRKGFSYKNTSLLVNTYNTVRNSQCVIGVIDKKYSTADMKMVTSYLDLLNDSTAWGKRREVIDKAEHKKASFVTMNDEGKSVERGYKSEIFIRSFQDNPEAANGLSPYYILFEEAGIFNNLKKSWDATVPSLKAGKKTVGEAIIFGTGGVTSDYNGEFSDMFYNPKVYNMMPFKNIWDEGSSDYCGFFFSAVYNLEGFYDRMGNSDIDGAMEYLVNERKRLLDTSKTIEAYNGYVIQFPICPRESFKSMGKNVFNIPQLERQLAKVRSGNLQFKMGTCVKLTIDDDNHVEAKPILDGSADPIIEWHHKNTDLTGCPIIYEYPVNNPPKGLYKIGYDPYAHDKSTSDSLAAIFVYKGVMRGDFSRNIIVAEYVGRPETADKCDDIALKLSLLYNTDVMFESNVDHTKKYFERRRMLHKLALQPDRVISKNIKKSEVARKFGCHLDKNMKAAGEEYVKEWLLTVLDYDENGDEITVIDHIYSIGLLEELIKYYRDGNFDRVCALFQIMFQLQDEELEKEYDEEEKSNERIKELLDFKLFRRL